MRELFSFGCEGFPDWLKPEYRCLSCLKADEVSSTYLAEAADGRGKVIVKTAEDAEGAALLRNEQRLLSLIARSERPEAAAFPRAIALVESNGACALVRDFVPGQSIEAIVESRASRPGMSRNEALDCAISLLEQLAFLHGLNPPIIHRDIKPQNVILDPQGHCHLIDLGISRQQRASDAADTQVMGTRLTAPPEQFGFRQTDARSDIYSAGVLLRYCLTGDYGERAEEALPGDLRRIVRRATRFDPARRYRRAEDMLSALRLARRMSRRLTPTRAVSVVLLLAALFAGLCCVLAPKPIPGSFDQRGVYHFQEPLIEQAVRAQLGIPERDLTAEDLMQVYALHIFGKLIYEDDDAFLFLSGFTTPWNDAIEESWRENGGIESLADLSAMPNLEALSLYRQNIRDISALRDTRIARIGLGLNPLSDISPLANNPNIEYLNLTALEISGTGVLATLPALRSLEISGTPLRDLHGLESLPLRRLNLHNVNPMSYEPVAAMESLESVTVSKLHPDLLKALSGLRIKSLEVTNAVDTSIADLEVLGTLERLLFRSEVPLPLEDAPFSFPRLRSLDLRNVSIPSLKCLSNLSALETLYIFDMECESYEGLENLRKLSNIICTAEQKRMLQAKYPSAGWAYPG